MAIVEGDRLAPAKAKGHLKKLLAANPQHVPGLLELSHLSYLGGDLDAARSHATPVTKELAAAASKKERSQAHLLIGLIAQARRQSTTAQTSLVEALSVDPTNTRALKALGEEFKRNRKYEEALNYFTTNAGLSQKDPEVMIGIVTSLLGLEKRDEAMQRLEQGITSFPKDPRFAFHLARIHAKQGNAHPARTNYEKALKADPNFTRAYVALALLSIESASSERNERTRAIARARELMAEAEKRGGARDPEVAVELGQVYMKLGERDRALEILNTALRLNASNLDARMGLADYYLGAGNSKKAAELLKPFEDSDVDDTELRILLARVFRAEGHYERAVDQFDKLAEADPKNAEYLYERGLTYFLWKNYPTSKQNFLDAYAKDPKLSKAYFYAGRVDFEEKRYPQAMKVFRSVLDESPQVGEFRFYLAYALEKNGNLPQALEEYKQVDRYDPEYGQRNPELYYRRGKIFFLQGNYRLAKMDLTRALKFDPKHDGALLTLADTTFEERDYRLAIKLYERALALDDERSLPHYKLGLAYKYLRERDKAIREVEKALSLGLGGRSEYKAHKMLGYEYKDKRSNAKAISHFKSYLKLLPNAADKDEIETQIRRLGGRVSN